MRGSYSTYRSPIHSYWAFDSYLVDQELHDSLSIYFLLRWVVIRLENTLLWLPVSPVVPNEHVAFSSQEKVEPVSVWRGYHPLVNKGIRVAHNDRRPVQVFFVRSFTLISWHGLRLKHNFIVHPLSSWEEHAVDLGLIPSWDRLNEKLLALKVLFHDELILDQVTKQ